VTQPVSAHEDCAVPLGSCGEKRVENSAVGDYATSVGGFHETPLRPTG